MTIELSVSENWTPGQALAARLLLQRVFRAGQPIIAAVRLDATPDQVKEIYDRVGMLIREAGLAS